MIEQATGDFYWYRPECAVDATGLNWLLRYRTYNPQTHEVGVSEYGINFEEHGIQNPAFARALVGLVEIGVITAPRLLDRLDHFQKQPRAAMVCEVPNPVSAFMVTSAYDFPENKFIPIYIEVGGLLTKKSINEYMISGLPSDLFELFDVITTYPDRRQAATAVDSYVSYYHSSRNTVLTKAEQLALAYADQLSKYNTVLKLEAQVNQLVNRDVTDNDKGFAVFVARLKRFAEDYLMLAPDGASRPGVTFVPSLGSPSLLISNPTLQLLLNTYKVQLISGVSSLFEKKLPEANLPPQTKRFHKLNPLGNSSAREIVHLDGDNLYTHPKYKFPNKIDILKTGMCPFFSVGFITS